MIQLVAVGLWLSIVALAAAYGGAEWAARKTNAVHGPDAKDGKLETVKLRMISVPIIAAGDIEGYVVTRLAYTAHAAELKAAVLKPDDFVADEVFRVIYAEWVPRDKSLMRQDLTALTKNISANVNQRLGQAIVRDILIQDLNFIPKKSIRMGVSP
jgi:hypothetical protein